MNKISIKDRLIKVMENMEQISVRGTNSVPLANGIVILDGVIKELEMQEREIFNEELPQEEVKNEEGNI